MPENHSASRRRAEAAFAEIRMKSSSRDRAFDEIEMLKAAREEKTLKLREARLAREGQDKAQVATVAAADGSKP